jgi:hypothetical protein
MGEAVSAADVCGFAAWTLAIATRSPSRPTDKVGRLMSVACGRKTEDLEVSRQ